MDSLLKGAKENLLKEMAVKNSDKYIAFPIVVLPCSDAGELLPNDPNGVKAYYVLWRKSRFEEKFSADTLDGRESPAGTFERWSFTYDTKGQQPTAMLSAKALTVKILEKPSQLEQLIPACEKVVDPFTALEAVDNIKALNFYTFEDVQKDADACIKSTRAILAAAQSLKGEDTPAVVGSVAAPALGTTQDAASRIANFGQGTVMGSVAPTAGAVAQTAGSVAAPVGNVAPAQTSTPSAGLENLLNQGAPTAPQFGV